MPANAQVGDTVTLKAADSIPNSTSLTLSGTVITPTEISNNQVTFVVPENAKSGPLSLKTDKTTSNTLLFSVSDLGVRAPKQNKIVADEEGNKVVIDYVLAVLSPAKDSKTEADRVAGLIDGSVIGRIALLNGWQIKVNADDLESLQAQIKTLEADTSVDFVVIDTEVSNDAIDWSTDAQFGQQRDRNRVTEGAELYASKVSPTLADDKILPFFMTIGASESGVDFNSADFDGYLNSDASTGNITIYAPHKASVHGTNVTGLIAAELGDSGNAGLLSALSDYHGGANISVTQGTSSYFSGIFSLLSSAEKQLEAGASVLNWSWGIHKQGINQCDGNSVTDNVYPAFLFDVYKRVIERFFIKLESKYPRTVVVASAGNGRTSIESNSRLPSGYDSPQMIVVSAHTSGGTLSSDSENTDDRQATSSCFDAAISTDVKRASYSNFGRKVDLAAAGSISGYNGVKQGTSYATPLVSATIALMQSVNPNLTPAVIKSLLRSSALPVENKVVLESGESVFTRPLSDSESSANSGKGARLNVEGAVQAAIDNLGSETLSKGDPVIVAIPAGTDQITQTVNITIPGKSEVFDKVDIMFTVDVSGSYSDDIETFRDKANSLVEAFSNSGTNVSMGITSFSDFPQAPYGAGPYVPGEPEESEEPPEAGPSIVESLSESSYDYEFRLDLPLTSDSSQVSDTLDALTIKNGNDFPESQLEALYQTALPATGWRLGALPVIFLATDAEFHDSDIDSKYPGTGRSKVVTTLKNKGIRVFGLQAGGDINDVLSITSDTGGQSFKLSRNSAEIIDAVTAALDSTTKNLSVTLEPYGDFARVIHSIVPTDSSSSPNGSAIKNVNPGDNISFDVTFNKGIFNDSRTHKLSFRLRVQADGVATIQEIPVVLQIN
ncbi:S8 family serine peptidase [Endozoicomonas sp. OPT23]|uniref:S8 family serine peptidase n=1 Tax=Endozoicomonas sp. OPT23 TaxID=2072845 RepID=UPI001891D248